MTEFEFTYPEEQMKKKFEWLQKLAEIMGQNKVTVKVIKEYQAEKVKPFTIEVEMKEQE